MPTFGKQKWLENLLRKYYYSLLFLYYKKSSFLPNTIVVMPIKKLSY